MSTVVKQSLCSLTPLPWPDSRGAHITCSDGENQGNQTAEPEHQEPGEMIEH